MTEKISDNLDDDIKKLMNINYSYPDPNDEDLQYKLYKKRELYSNKSKSRPEIKLSTDKDNNVVVDDYNAIREYREYNCARDFRLHPFQSLLGSMINPDTPYKGCIVFHGLGTGKCILGTSCVHLKLDGVIKSMRISDIWDKYSSDVYITENNEEWGEVNNEIIVNSFDKTTNNIVGGRVIKLYREKINSVINYYYLENNKIIGATMIHKLLIYKDSKIYFSNSLSEGDLIGCIDVNNEIMFSRIKTIITMPYNNYVYDLEVDMYHNYIANDIVCHNTCAGVAIGEQFKLQAQKYNTKIYVLVSGPLIKENWKEHVIKCTGETYMNKIDKSITEPEEIIRLKKQGIMNALQYYKFMSYKSFYKRVLGEKIIEKREGNKITYRKTDEGEFERDISVDRIYNLNNTLIIVDEAHNLTGNAYGDALMHIIKNSINLKIVLMSATPMKNLADDIIELINFIRPIESPMERDKIFTGDKNFEMKLKKDGLDYFKKMASGYISHVRGYDPLTFAKRIDKGELIDGLLFTKVIRCYMNDFQYKIYETTVIEAEDALDRKSEAIANFVFPCLSDDLKSVKGCSGNNGLIKLIGQIKTNHSNVNKIISETLIKRVNKDDKDDKDDESDLVKITSDGHNITGRILNKKYLKTFSTKFYKALKNINRLIWGKKGAKTAFIYSNLVKVGIEIFGQILIQNGYLEYNEDPSQYQINKDTLCYYCGRTHENHNKDIKDDDSDEEDYNEYRRHKKSKEIPQHKFQPATFITVTGKGSEESADTIPEEKKKILDEVFNIYDNLEGKYIKLILGSKVMNEGISLINTGEVHILDVYFNLGRVDQVVGRGIRNCSHYKQMTPDYIFPYVNVYKYVVSLEKGGLSSEENLYRKAELKYLEIKKIERSMKEVAFDCGINREVNIMKEEVEQYENCKEIKEGHHSTDKDCPQVCDFTNCDYKCNSNKLNAEYYDPTRKMYKEIIKNDLDMTTFNSTYAKNEIDLFKNKIKELYLLDYMYTLSDIIAYVRGSISSNDIFDEFFVYKALDELIPTNENEINSLRDTIVDKNNRHGYIIYVDKYYLFQPFDQNEDVPIYYRTTYVKPISQSISLYNYLKYTPEFKEFKKHNEDRDILSEQKLITYNFDEAMEYYDNREENKYVGIIDKEVDKKKSKDITEIQDVFKIRDKRGKITDKKRGTGIQTLKGSVCTTKERGYIVKVCNDLGINTNDQDTRFVLCDKIKDIMLNKEKYSTGKDKKTYIMIPINHPIYKFPYNLEDRLEYITKILKSSIPIKINFDVKKEKDKKDAKDAYKINLIITGDNISDYEEILFKNGFEKENKGYTIKIE
jgi:superfamily II DNA or RNA helicase